MVITKESRVFELTVEQLTKVVTDSIGNAISPQQEDIPLNIEQVVQFLGMPKPTVYLKCKEGLPHMKQGGRLFFFKRDIVDWLRKFQVIPTEQASAEFFGDFKSNYNSKK
jgi:predicted DNA-binding transcriptional regulator AlpA